MISCLLLSAGLSRRFGSPKALATIHSKTVIGHLQEMLVKTRIDEIIVVLGANADSIKPHILNHTKIKLVYNKDYNFGQTSSFKAGLRNISDKALGLLLLPVDYPCVCEETIDTLVKYFSQHQPMILVPSFKGKKGHPPLFSLSLKEEFLTLDNDVGINSITHIHQTETTILPVEDCGVVASFNTQEELKAMARSR